jgi:energy-coupling factor transporter ATP-binding protein EcfA2
MRRAIVLSGCSGSGKTRLAGHLKGLIQGSRHSSIIVSAEPDFKGGFDRNRCLRSFVDCIGRNYHVVIVDAVNASSEELIPFISFAEASDMEVELITLRCRSLDEVRMAHARNLHMVSLASVVAQHEKIENRKLATPWRQTEIHPFDTSPRISGEYLRSAPRIENAPRSITPSKLDFVTLRDFKPIGRIGQ